MPLMEFFIAVHTAPQHCVVSVSCFINVFSSGVQGRRPSRGPGERSPPEAGAFLKYTASNLRPGENERHNLMPLVAFFIAVHTRIVLFQCDIAQCLAQSCP